MVEVEDKDTGILTVVLLDSGYPRPPTQGLLPSTLMACSPVPTRTERSSTQESPSECLVSVVAIIRCLYMCDTAYNKVSISCMHTSDEDLRIEMSCN